MKVKTTFALFCLTVFLFGCAPIAQTATETPVPPTSTETATATATATETATPTATEVPAYNICPPETSDPRGCTLSSPDDLLNPNKFLGFLRSLTKPFLANTEPLKTPIPTTTTNPSGEKLITFVDAFTYDHGGPDDKLAVRLLGTSAYLEMNIDGVTYGWFIYPMELQNPKDPTNKDANRIVIGIAKVKAPGIPRPIDQIAQIAPGLIKQLPVLGFGVGEKDTADGEIDPLEKIQYQNDPEMDRAFEDFISGNLDALNGKVVILDIGR
jgi:hypothetical protein